MSTIKRKKVTSSKRASSKTVNSDIVYDYALRCAIRANLEQSEKSTASTTVTTSSTAVKKNNNEEELNREILKGITRRLQDIYKEKDLSKLEYMDNRFKSICRIVKRTLLEKHKYRPTGTITDVIILFLQTSETELKKIDSNNPSLWYDDLQKFMDRFVELVIQTIKQDSPAYATPEMIEKLSVYCSHSKKPKRSSANSNSNNNKSQLELLQEFPMIITIKKLFGVKDAEFNSKLKDLLPVCTESALLNDLKKCINNVHTIQDKKNDFATSIAYENWQKKEVRQLTELMNSMMILNPNLRISSRESADVGNTNLLSRSSSNSSMSSTNSLVNDQKFTYIPNDPKNSYRLLMKMCLDHDVENISVISDAERSKTSILSLQSDELLRECWKTWRLSSPFRAILYLGFVRSKYDQDQLTIDDVSEAMKSLDKVAKESDMESWAITDLDNLVRTLEGLNNSLLHQLADGLTNYWKIRPAWMQDILGLLDRIYANSAYTNVYPDPKSEVLHLEDSIKGAAVERWGQIEKKSNLSNQDAMANLLTMADNLNKELSSITKKKFPGPIMGLLSVPSIVMARQMPYFALEMENWSCSSHSKNCPIDIAFELYQKVLNLEKMYDEYGPRAKKSLFKVEFWFLPHVKRWLLKTSESTAEWVRNAIEQDQFKQTSEMVTHSSSIIDLFSMLNQAVDFIINLDWPNEMQQCLFQTYLSKIIGEAMENYCFTLEDLARYDLFPPTNNDSKEVDLPSSILDKARYQIMGGRGLNKDDQAPENIPPKVCVKLNNVESTRAKLDKLYQIMRADDIAQFMRENVVPQNAYKSGDNSYVYTIKIVRAENLQPLDNNGLSDPYVTLEIDGKQITRTRTVYETLNPRWDQQFDIWSSDERTLDVLAIVSDEDVITTDEECGSAWFKLSPEYYNDYQTHELVLHLSPQGTLVLQISMEGEKNDIQFWFGKSFRTLKSSENDIAELIVDKMRPYIRHCLSRQVIDRLLERNIVGFFSAFSRVANKQVEPDLQACEDAIVPLLDYLEKNLQILNDNLSETNVNFVVLKIWNQILQTIDSILLPPLSEHVSQTKALDLHELHVVFKWLELLKVFFNGGEDGDAIPLDHLENTSYYSLIAINTIYNMKTYQLFEEYLLLSSKSNSNVKLTGKPADRSKTIYHSKNTIRQKRKSETKKKDIKKPLLVNVPSGDAILRLLRMRHDKQAIDFLNQEFSKRNSAYIITART